MKRKEVEKIPYITKKNVAKIYNIVVSVQKTKIKEENYLIVDIYKENKEMPEERYVYTKKEFACYYPGKGKWSKKRMVPRYSDKPNWNPKRENIYITKKDEKMIMAFVGKGIGGSNCWDRIGRLETAIMREKERKDSEKRSKELNERTALLPSIPKEFKEWYEGELFKNDNFLYYKRKGIHATMTCSKCGETYTVRTKYPETIEQTVEKIQMPVPVRNENSECLKCGAKGIYRTKGGKENEVYGISRRCYIGQNITNGIVIRCYDIEKRLSVGNKERFIEEEIARVYIRKGEKTRKDYHLYNGYLGGGYWHDRNESRYGRAISLFAADVFPGTKEVIENSHLKYSGYKEYENRKKRKNEKPQIVQYLSAYNDFPAIESIEKIGFNELVDQIINKNYSYYNLNLKAEKLEDILGIRKKRIMEVKGKRRLIHSLKVFQLEHLLGENWRPEEVDFLCNWYMDISKLKRALSYMTVKQLIYRIGKYAKCREIEITEKKRNRERTKKVLDINQPGKADSIGHYLQTYLDYIEMKEAAGYDMTNSIIQFPKDIQRAHNEMVIESNRGVLSSRIEQVEKKYKKIRKMYNRLEKEYKYEDEKYIIRPAASPEEIVLEGKILHHCVGRDFYLEKHDKGSSFILFLRDKENETEPFITVEFDGEKILQWYGEWDTKPYETEIKEFLNKWENALIDKQKKAV